MCAAWHLSQQLLQTYTAGCGRVLASDLSCSETGMQKERTTNYMYISDIAARTLQNLKKVLSRSGPPSTIVSQLHGFVVSPLPSAFQICCASGGEAQNNVTKSSQACENERCSNLDGGIDGGNKA